MTQRPQRAARLGNKAVGDGARYHGRGFVQLTWKSNYLKMSEHLSAVTGEAVDLVARPELAKQLDHAVEILLHGMVAGALVNRAKRRASWRCPSPNAGASPTASCATAPR